MSFLEPIVLLVPAWVAAISVYVLVTGGHRPGGPSDGVSGGAAD